MERQTEAAVERRIEEVLASLHKTSGLPRLEIEGIGRYRKHPQLENESAEWLRHDGFAGQIGGINVMEEYLTPLEAEKGDRCAYVIKDTWYHDGSYETVIKIEHVLFTKTDLRKAIADALEGKPETQIQGKWLVDNTTWDDSIPCGPGKTIRDVTVNLAFDFTKENPLTLTYVDKCPDPVKEMIDRIVEARKTYPFLIVSDSSEDAIFQIGSGRVDESGGGSYHDIDDITFPKSELLKFVGEVIASEEKYARYRTKGVRNTDILHWSYGTVDGRTESRDNEEVEIDLYLRIVNDVPTFHITEARKPDPS
jgi:hypothetical protein